MNSSVHLTEEQILKLLDQPDAEGAERVHLAECAACRSEVVALRESMVNFRLAVTGMALAQTRRRPVAEAKRSGLRRHVWSVSFATAAVLLATVVSVMRPGHEAPVVATPNVSAGMPAAVSDEALLEGIQSDLATTIPPSLEPLAVPAASGSTPTSN